MELQEYNIETTQILVGVNFCDILTSHDAVTENSLKKFSPVETVVDSKCTKDASKNVYTPLVMGLIWGRKRTFADKTVYPNGSIDTSFDTPLFFIRQ